MQKKGHLDNGGRPGSVTSRKLILSQNFTIINYCFGPKKAYIDSWCVSNTKVLSIDVILCATIKRSFH